MGVRSNQTYTLANPKGIDAGGSYASLNISQEYFDFDVLNQENTTSYVELSGLPSSDTSKISFSNTNHSYEHHDGDSEGESIDLDGDGQDEIVIYRSVAMTHSPHQIIIFRDGQVVFESEIMSRVSLSQSPSGNGFYFYGTPREEIGSGYRVVRFIVDGDSFKPVWQQRIEYLQFSDRRSESR
jgi:hypothetical protein